MGAPIPERLVNLIECTEATAMVGPGALDLWPCLEWELGLESSTGPFPVRGGRVSGSWPQYSPPQHPPDAPHLTAPAQRPLRAPAQAPPPRRPLAPSLPGAGGLNMAAGCRGGWCSLCTAAALLLAAVLGPAASSSSSSSSSSREPQPCGPFPAPGV